MRFRRKDNTPTAMTTIDLHLPTSWNACTTADLEAIAAAIIHEQQRTDRYHPFDWSRVKLAVVLSINGITVLRDTDTPKNAAQRRAAAGRVVGDSVADIAASDDEYLVRRPQDRAPWPITTAQLVALTDRLAFLDDPKANRTIYAFPYPTLDVRCKKEEGKAISHQPSSIIHLVGPAPLLDGYTWQEYRYLTDWMQEYMRRANAHQDATEPMAQFLAVLFKPASRVVGDSVADNSGGRNTDIPSSRNTDTLAAAFASFDAIRWQVILFWWSSLMALLQAKFPRVFKPQPVGRGRQQKKNETPWDFYNRVTAMLADEYKSSEADQQNETYGVTLQKLQNMADKAAELEKLKNKK